MIENNPNKTQVTRITNYILSYRRVQSLASKQLHVTTNAQPTGGTVFFINILFSNTLRFVTYLCLLLIIKRSFINYFQYYRYIGHLNLLAILGFNIGSRLRPKLKF